MTNQRQQGGDGSLNFQAGQDLNYYHQSGISYQDAKQIAEDVYNRNALALAGVAVEAAMSRAEELNENFLRALRESPHASLEVLKDPDIQYDLYTAQQAYARSGSLPLAATLVNLLVDRCSTHTQGIEALVLNEAIATIPKITPGQSNLLTLSWILRHATTKIVSVEEHGRLFEEYIGPLLEDLPTTGVDIQHLQYAGCLATGVSGVQFHDLLTHHYGHLYANAFGWSVVPVALQPSVNDRRYFRPVGEGTWRTTSGMERAQLREDDLAGMDDVQARAFRRLKDEYRFPETRIVSELQPHFSRIHELAEIWSKSTIKFAELTSVGIAIAHANAVRTSGFDGPLAVWIH